MEFTYVHITLSTLSALCIYTLLKDDPFQLTEVGRAQTGHFSLGSVDIRGHRILLANLDPIPRRPEEERASGQEAMLISLLTLNPGVPQPPLLPDVISFRPAKPLEYKNGFKKPKGDLPAFNRTSLRRATNPANVGEDADVPPIKLVRPPTTTLKKSDCAATSGKAYFCQNP